MKDKPTADINRTIRGIPSGAYRRIKIEAARRGCSVNRMLIIIIENYAEVVKE